MVPTRKALMAALAALVIAVSAWSEQGRTKAYDQQIQEAAGKKLKGDKFKDITTSVDDQIITLQGFVPILMDKVNAEKKVKGIDKVEGVINHIQVSTDVPDAELREKLSNKLAYDRIGYGIMFNNLTLQVQNGIATVGGVVHDYPDRDSALAIVETMPGVKGIVDNIEVAPTSNFDDELRVRLAQAIYGDPVLAKYRLNPVKPIRIIVENGHVTLEGAVDSSMDKIIAGTRANEVSGVFSVQNNLMVAGGGETPKKKKS